MIDIKAPTKLKPGDLLEALEFNEPGLRILLTSKFNPENWAFSQSSAESPEIERMMHRFGIFTISLERLKACDTPPHFKLRKTPGLWKVYRGSMEVGISELPANGNVVVSSRFQLGIGSSFELLTSKEYTYLRPITQEVFIARISTDQNKYVEPPIFQDLPRNRQELLRKEFVRIYL